MSVLMPGGDATADRLLQLAGDFVRLVSDKDGAQKRLIDLAKATTAAEQLIERANKASKASDERIAEHEARIKAELAEHEDLLLRGRQALEKERATFEKTRDALIAEASRLRDEAQHDHEAASAKLKQLNDKLSVIQAAVA